MFTEKAQAIIDLAKDCAFARMKEELDIPSLLAAVGDDTEAGVRLAECLTGGDTAQLRAKCPDLGDIAVSCPGKLEMDPPFRELIVSASELASGKGIPDRVHPGLINIKHLVCALALSREACSELGGLAPISRENALHILSTWHDGTGGMASIANLVDNLRGLRAELLSKVFGQDHAIHTFVEGLYNAEVTAASDKERRRPAAVFVFAGPPGIGKTYISELCAAYLERPFKRFDMTGFSDHQAQNTLIGFAPSYKGAHPGTLTGFVEKNPDAILLFDEIEKAHLTTVQLFYQILDAGRLEDKYTEKDVSFRNTTIIFTTNAGRALYDNPNRAGINTANSSYHKRTILSALENEKNSADGRPAFPQAICSRLAQGYPVMFNHLGINELERICEAEIIRTENLLEQQYYKKIEHDSLLPMALVYREGGRVDARQLRSEAEKFIKSELFKYCSLYSHEKLDEVLNKIDNIRFEVECDISSGDLAVNTLFRPAEKTTILLIASQAISTICNESIPEIEWLASTSLPEIIDILSTRDIDMVLLDIWLRRDVDSVADIVSGKTIIQSMDFTPLSARALNDGREILQNIHSRSPQTPVYLLSFTDSQGNDTGSALNKEFRRPVDDELFLACVRSGGARAIISTGFLGKTGKEWEKERDCFVRQLQDAHSRLYLQAKANSIAQERKVLSFYTAAEWLESQKMLIIRLRDFSLRRAIDALDAGELVDDIERPGTRFADVIGAKSAKQELQFIIDYLKNPKRYTALGIRPPKGILLAGPPGTGKTLLARAIAGETNCAFIEKSASSFVTMWQGSGPQNVRDLFGRARRYAPAVVFLDEIDAIGVRRSGGLGGARTQEETLNAMLTEMDGFAVHAQHPVIVLAATNLADKLDEALQRRFDRIIDVDKPDMAARKQYLEKVLLQRKNCEVTQQALDRLAGQTADLTIADLERIVHSSAVLAARKAGMITDEILAETYDNFIMGEARATPGVKALQRTAQHESGHALVAWLGGSPPVRLTVVGRSKALGFMESERDEQKGSYTKIELEQMIRVSMAGRAAEILYYGNEEGLDTGVASDLKKASSLAMRMVSEWGMAEEFGQVAIQPTQDGPLAEKVMKTAEKIVRQQLDKTIEILRENQKYLDKMVEELLSKNTLYREDLEKILPPIQA